MDACQLQGISAGHTPGCHRQRSAGCTPMLATATCCTDGPRPHTYFGSINACIDQRLCPSCSHVAANNIYTVECWVSFSLATISSISLAWPWAVTTTSTSTLAPPGCTALPCITENPYCSSNSQRLWLLLSRHPGTVPFNKNL